MKTPILTRFALLAVLLLAGGHAAADPSTGHGTIPILPTSSSSMTVPITDHP